MNAYQIFSIHCILSAYADRLPSPARTLGSWFRVPLKLWMFVCAFILCLLCLVCRWRPCRELIPRPRSPTDRYRLCKNDDEIEEEVMTQQRAVVLSMNE
jgi:hypothetical protein